MHNSSFIVIKDRINEVLKSITVDDFYFGELKSRVIKEFELPEDYEGFIKGCDEVFLSLQKVEKENSEKVNSFKSSIELLKKQEEDILKEIEEFHAKIKKQNDELNGIPSKVKDKNVEISKLESEISIVKSLADKEPYITQLQKLNSDNIKLEEWINRSPELKNRISDSISQLKKHLEVKQADMDLLKHKITNEENLLKEFLKGPHYQMDITEEAEAVKSICQYVYNINIAYSLDSHSEYDSGKGKYFNTGFKILRLWINSNPISVPASFIQNQNIDFKKNWRDTLLKLLNEPPDFSNITSVNYCESFPNWNFEIYSNPIDINLFAAIWMSLQNALKNKPGLMTKDGRLYLWITNSIFAEIWIRRQKNERKFLGLFTIKKTDSYKREFYDSQTDMPRIIGGYTYSGFFIPYGVYIIDNQISLEIYFHQNALLQETASNIIEANQLSSANLEEDRRRKAEDDDDD